MYKVDHKVTKTKSLTLLSPLGKNTTAKGCPRLTVPIRITTDLLAKITLSKTDEIIAMEIASIILG